MTTNALIVELRRRATPTAGDAPAWALEEAIREIVSVIATARLGSAREGELGEIDPLDLDAKAQKAASLACDFTRWPQYRARAANRQV